MKGRDDRRMKTDEDDKKDDMVNKEDMQEK